MSTSVTDQILDMGLVFNSLCTFWLFIILLMKAQHVLFCSRA